MDAWREVRGVSACAHRGPWDAAFGQSGHPEPQSMTPSCAPPNPQGPGQPGAASLKVFGLSTRELLSSSEVKAHLQD